MAFTFYLVEGENNDDKNIVKNEEEQEVEKVDVKEKNVKKEDIPIEENIALDEKEPEKSDKGDLGINESDKNKENKDEMTKEDIMKLFDEGIHIGDSGEDEDEFGMMKPEYGSSVYAFDTVKNINDKKVSFSDGELEIPSELKEMASKVKKGDEVNYTYTYDKKSNKFILEEIYKSIPPVAAKVEGIVREQGLNDLVLETPEGKSTLKTDFNIRDDIKEKGIKIGDKVIVEYLIETRGDLVNKEVKKIEKK